MRFRVEIDRDTERRLQWGAKLDVADGLKVIDSITRTSEIVPVATILEAGNYFPVGNIEFVYKYAGLGKDTERIPVNVGATVHATFTESLDTGEVNTCVEHGTQRAMTEFEGNNPIMLGGTRKLGTVEVTYSCYAGKTISHREAGYIFYNSFSNNMMRGYYVEHAESYKKLIGKELPTVTFDLLGTEVISNLIVCPAKVEIKTQVPLVVEDMIYDETKSHLLQLYSNKRFENIKTGVFNSSNIWIQKCTYCLDYFSPTLKIPYNGLLLDWGVLTRDEYMSKMSSQKVAKKYKSRQTDYGFRYQYRFSEGMEITHPHRECSVVCNSKTVLEYVPYVSVNSANLTELYLIGVMTPTIYLYNTKGNEYIHTVITSLVVNNCVSKMFDEDTMKAEKSRTQLCKSLCNEPAEVLKYMCNQHFLPMIYVEKHEDSKGLDKYPTTTMNGVEYAVVDVYNELKGISDAQYTNSKVSDYHSYSRADGFTSYVVPREIILDAIDRTVDYISSIV